MGWGDGREVQEGGDICINIADTFHCTAEINTTLQSNYIPIFFNLKTKVILLVNSRARIQFQFSLTPKFSPLRLSKRQGVPEMKGRLGCFVSKGILLRICED